ncbi:MAG: sigma-70 family RNA polymerase sigma factor [Clostridia bacterium]|jgi:RNA polymerase sigma-70 factor (ECF subfamily)|nr:sigma-70 family RNA polymerase sigma factor [Clostridia bacterium]MBQ1554114.1 sigma-70 family RNA polymerase sigma factor [Clostridia bacterium]MBQ4397503.1 sigma-70 family RNA polymerase sigma factor [Clostridia bacterium]MBQ5544429.1 sigma-70 family RNA polymerase sigma factor [Clostridia bacterium]
MEEWIARHGKRLYALCIRLCGSTYEADDLYQETWLRVYSKRGQYDPLQPFEPWLTAVCVNAYRDLRRRERFSRLMAPFSDTEEKERVLTSVPDNTPAVENAELWEAVRSLPETYRTVIVLHYYSGYDVREMARILTVPEGTVKYRLHRARELLKGGLTP